MYSLWRCDVSEELKCHMCGNPTDYCCQDCGEPVCEDCCVPYDQFTQIDYTLCQSCRDGQEASDWLARDREHKRQEAIKAKRDARNAASKKRYWKPENVEKRRLAKIERNRLRVERNRKMLAEAFRIVADWTK